MCLRTAFALPIGYLMPARHSFEVPAGVDVDAVITLADQPIRDSNCQRDGGQAKKLCCVNAAKIKNDELSINCQQSDKKHDLRLNDALLPIHDKLQGCD